jgi:hypothetical protein
MSVQKRFEFMEKDGVIERSSACPPALAFHRTAA